MNISLIFEQLSKKLKKFSDNDIIMLEKGYFDIIIKTESQTSQVITTIDFNAKMIIEQLRAVKSREDAHAILTDLNLTLKNLEGLASELGISYLKGESKNKLSNRIIEKTIGFRLNSKAVRGDN